MNVVCPFCPLHCDDLRVDAVGNINVDCSIARDAFATALNPTAARIGASTVSLAEATKHVRDLVDGRVPVIIAPAVAIATAKCFDQFRSDGRIKWVMEQTAARASLQRTISRDGMIGATLAEVRRHADCIWIIGNRDQKMLPRIDEWATSTTGDATQICWRDGVTARQLGDLLDAIRREEKPSESALSHLFDAASQAAYFAVIWVDDGFDSDEADVSSALLLELIAVLNDPKRRQNRRAVLVTFDAAQSARSVSLWRRNEVPDDGASLSSDHGAIMIRLGESVDSDTSVSIQMGGRDPGHEFAGVFVPTSVEGIHCSDTVIRGDGAVTLPLKPFTASDLPTARQWLSEWLDS